MQLLQVTPTYTQTLPELVAMHMCGPIQTQLISLKCCLPQIKALKITSQIQNTVGTLSRVFAREEPPATASQWFSRIRSVQTTALLGSLLQGAWYLPVNYHASWDRLQYKHCADTLYTALRVITAKEVEL